MPVTEQLSHSWYDTPNIHFCTITDFIALASELGAVIDASVALDQRRPALVTAGRDGRGTSSASKRSSSCTARTKSAGSGQALLPLRGGGLRRGVAPILGQLRVR